jgi:hypothetical protein
MARKFHGRNKMGGAYKLKCECGTEAVGLKGHVDHTHKRCPLKVRGRWRTA